MIFKAVIGKCIDLIFCTRPVVVIPVWGFAIFGFNRCHSFTAGDVWSFLPPEPLLHHASFYSLSIAFIFSLSVAAVYVFNQIADYETDKLNGGRPLIASGAVSRQSAMIFTLFLSFVSIIIPLVSGFLVIALCSMIALLLGLVYSFKPFRLSGRPILDFTANAAGYGLVAFGAGWSLGGGSLLTHSFFVNAVPYVLLMASGSISSTLPDIQGDKASGKITTAVAFGRKKAHYLAFALLACSCIFSFVIKDAVALLCGSCALPLYLAYCLRIESIALMEATYKAGGAVCMIIAGILFPPFIPASAAVFFFTWLYFRYRHGVRYPSLVPVRTDE